MSGDVDRVRTIVLILSCEDLAVFRPTLCPRPWLVLKFVVVRVLKNYDNLFGFLCLKVDSACPDIF